MIQICNKCFKIYKLLTYVKTKDGYKTVADEILPCPKISCGGELFECDELFAPSISILNKKGYSTVYSCSGHINADYCITYNPKYKKVYKHYSIHSYISFKKDIKLPTLPNGYIFDSVNDEDEFITIRKIFNARKRPKTLLKLIIQNSMDVLEWAENLKFKGGKNE